MNDRTDNLAISTGDIDDALLSLVADCASGTLDEAGRVQLDERLRTDDHAVTFYAAYMRMHAQLGWASREAGGELSAVSDQPSALSKKQVGAQDVEVVPKQSALVSLARGDDWRLQASLRKSLAVTAGIFLCALVALYLIPARFWIADKTKDALPVAPAEWIALLKGSQDAVWLDGTRPNRLRLMPGKRLAIESGSIELMYRTGARVVLEGPADFTVGTKGKKDSIHQSSLIAQYSNAGYLELGKLVARIENEDATGFTVTTPSATVKDLGTEFGVEVLATGAAEVLVLTGAVDLTRQSADGIPSEPMRLTKNQGARVATNGAIHRREQVDTGRVAEYRKRLDEPVTTQYPTGVVPSGAVEFVLEAPRNVTAGALESDARIVLFRERSGVALEPGATAGITAPGRYGATALRASKIKGAGYVDSYLLHFDPINRKEHFGLLGSVTFDRPIVGIHSANGLLSTDSKYGSRTTMYGTDKTRGIDPPADLVALSADRRTVTVRFQATTSMDQVRVLTQAPEDDSR